MSIEVMKLALETLEQHGTPLLNHEDAYSASLTALRQAIAEAEKQEPDELTIAYMSGFFDGKKKREWVGLTEEEIDRLNFLSVEGCQCSFGYVDNVEEFAQSIEAKLREKNGC
jgi:protoheme ferro-lyase